MLIKLMKYELSKKWNALRYVLLGYILLQTLLLIIARSFLWNSGMIKFFAENDSNPMSKSVPFVLTMILYFILTIFIAVLPLIEGLYRFGKDLSGKQAVLELMMPIVSWKKIISKLITALCGTIISTALAAASIAIFILINSNFDKNIINAFAKFFELAIQSPIRFIFGILYIVFCFLSIYMIVFSCIAFSKCFSHKNKIAVPIGIIAFIIFIAVFGLINTQIQRIPLIKFNILGTVDTLSSIIVSILVFLAALFGTSWLMENRIEL